MLAPNGKLIPPDQVFGEGGLFDKDVEEKTKLAFKVTMKKLEKYNTASEFNKEHLKTAKVDFQFEPRNVFKFSIFPGGPGGGVLPQHPAEAVAEHNPEDEVVEEVKGGGELGHLVVDAREDPSTSQSSSRGHSQVVSVSEFQKKTCQYLGTCFSI